MTKKSPKELGFIHVSEAYSQALDYAEKRRTGEIRSIRTPWEKFNEVSMNGLEWNSLTVIAGRPGSGKTLIGSMIAREAFRLNPEQAGEFCVVDFQFEMLARNIALREISGHTGINVRRLTSVAGSVTDEDLAAAHKYCQDNKYREIYTWERPLTVDKMREKIYQFYEAKEKKMIITVDHSLLLRKSASEKENKDILYNLGYMLAETRRQLPVIFIVLSQLNREIETVERVKNASIGNFVKDSDVFGADAMLQFTDILIGINRPAKYGITLYGPPNSFHEDERYRKGIPVDINSLAVHFLKVRSGEPCLTMFKADFARSNILQL
jgi:replicative DNA helicase